MATNRPAIPEPVKREVRRRCGFGCIFCGIPIFQYDHLVPWERSQSHEPSNLTLLCSQCHDAKTRGRISERRVIEKNARPFNRNKSRTAAAVPGHLDSDNYIFQVSSSLMRVTTHDGYAYPLVVLDGEVTLGVRREEDQLLLDLTAYGDDGNVVFQIVAGELTVSTSVWDYDFVGTTLKIRHERRRIAAHVELTPTRLALLKLRMRGLNGTELHLDDIALAIQHRQGQTVMEACSINQGCLIADLDGFEVAPIHPDGYVAALSTAKLYMRAVADLERSGEKEKAGHLARFAGMQAFEAACREHDVQFLQQSFGLMEEAIRLLQHSSDPTLKSGMLRNAALIKWEIFRELGNQNDLKDAIDYVRHSLSYPENDWDTKLDYVRARGCLGRYLAESLKHSYEAGLMKEAKDHCSYALEHYDPVEYGTDVAMYTEITNSLSVLEASQSASQST